MPVWLKCARFHAHARTCPDEQPPRRLDELENKTDLQALTQETFEHNARVQFKQVIATLRELMAPPEPPKKRPIGFVTQDEPATKRKAQRQKK